MHLSSELSLKSVATQLPHIIWKASFVSLIGNRNSIPSSGTSSKQRAFKSRDHVYNYFKVIQDQEISISVEHITSYVQIMKLMKSK